MSWPSLPGAPALAAAIVGALSVLGLLPATAVAAVLPPGIIAPPPGVLAPPRPPLAPGLRSLDVTPSAVTIGWYDRSTDEQKFVLYRRDEHGDWQEIYEVPTRDTTAADGDYSYVDTDRSLSGQCYLVAAVGQDGTGSTDEECTVRPDPASFPQGVPKAAKQWSGLASVNDGTGPLRNWALERSEDTALRWHHQTFGINLNWTSPDHSLWKIQAEGGPRLMYGQAVALRVWGGGWIKYGRRTWGINLVWSHVPVYQWYVLGGAPGTSKGSEDFALWNRVAGDYLVYHKRTGVDLAWYSDTVPPSSTGTVHEATVSMVAQPPVEGYVPFLGYFGGGPGNTSVLTKVSNPSGGATLLFPRPGHGSQDCGDPSDVIALAPGATMAPADLQTLWGSATPSLSQRLAFLACAATQSGSVAVNVEYRGQ